MNKSFVTRNECQLTHQNIMEEFEKTNNKIENLRVELAAFPEKLIEKMDKKYVSIETFKPVQKVVYGLVGAVLFASLSAVLVLIYK